MPLFFPLNVGITAVVARRKGQDNRAGANQTLRLGITLSFLAACVTCSLGYLFAEPLLIFCGAEDSYLAMAIEYFRILTISLLFTALNITINAAQRGCGKTKISMYTNIAANLVNVLFNYLLINGFSVGGRQLFPRLGVRGAAIATLLGSMVACTIAFATLCRKSGYLSFWYRTSWKINRLVLQPVMRVSSSAFVEQVFMRIGFLAYAVIVARLGETAYATHLICMNILSLSFSFGDGFAVAASALVGQNLGAKRPDLATVYGKTGQRIAFLISTVLCIGFIGGRSFLVSLFSDTPLVIEMGAVIMILIACSTHAQTSQVVLNGCLRGAGDTVYVAATSLLSIAVVRPLLTWLLCFPLGFGLYGAWISLIIDQSLRFFLSFFRFNSGKWSKIKL